MRKARAALACLLAVTLAAMLRADDAPPLGWCVYGSIHFRSAGSDYPAVAEALLAAGAEMIPFPREQMSPEMLAVFDRRAKA